MIVGSHFSTVDRSFGVFLVYLFCQYTATLFLFFFFFLNETLSKAIHIECGNGDVFRYFGFQRFSLPATAYVPLLF